MAIVKLFRVDRPASFLGVAKDRRADCRNPGDERRNIVAKGDKGLGLGDRGNNLIGKIIDKAHEEMAGAHGGVADFEIEKPLGRIDSGKDPRR